MMPSERSQPQSSLICFWNLSSIRGGSASSCFRSRSLSVTCGERFSSSVAHLLRARAGARGMRRAGAGARARAGARVGVRVRARATASVTVQVRVRVRVRVRARVRLRVRAGAGRPHHERIEATPTENQPEVEPRVPCAEVGVRGGERALEGGDAQVTRRPVPVPHEVQVEAVEAELDEASRHVTHVEARVPEGHPLTHSALFAGHPQVVDCCALGHPERAGLAILAREARRTQVPHGERGGRDRVRRGEGDLVRCDELCEDVRRAGGQERGHQQHRVERERAKPSVPRGLARVVLALPPSKCSTTR